MPLNLYESYYTVYNYIDMHPSCINGAISGSIYFYNHNPG